MKPFNYAKNEILAGKFPQIGIFHVAGSYYLTDADDKLLSGKTYDSKEAAITDRSKILDRARKAAGF